MTDTSAATLQAYCVKCKTKRDLGSPEPVYTKTGTPGTRGQCGECGTSLFRMGATAAHDGIPKPEKTERPKRKKTKPKSKAKSNAKWRNIGKLVIVESPKKARNIGEFLGDTYTVISSRGHVRDLLKSRLSVDVENDFEPEYRVPNDKRDFVKELKAAAESADEIYLATDPDREGEAIAWHLVAAAEMQADKLRRVVFYETNKSPVLEAFAHPRTINMDLVDAQQARRILDRLVGYKVTDLLRLKARKGLTAGRVQSIALRLVVEREKEIRGFEPVEYWTIDALLSKQKNTDLEDNFKAGLLRINDRQLARSANDLNKPKSIALHTHDDIELHLETLNQSQFVVNDVKLGKRSKKPSPPFTTTTMRVTAESKLGFRPKKSSRIAQQLYDGIEMGEGTIGLITYIRTDSVNVSPQALEEARQYVQRGFGKDFLPKSPRIYRTKEQRAQEAHEAIRPTSVTRLPKQLEPFLTHDQFRLYQLIWQRFVASQMMNAEYDTVRLDIKAGLVPDDMPYLFRSTASQLRFPGFLALDESTKVENDEISLTAEIAKNDYLNLHKVLPHQHFTQPPPRYSAGKLEEALEEKGIGRPATRESIISKLIDSPERDYINSEGRILIPTDTGIRVVDLLSEYFDVEMDYTYTARIEDQLDEISEGKTDWRPMLDDFYQPFKQRLKNAFEYMPEQDMGEYVGRTCPACKAADLVVIYGRRGKFIGCPNYPECRHTEPFGKPADNTHTDKPRQIAVEKVGRPCPTCGVGNLLIKHSRYGKFIGCSNFPKCRHTEPISTGFLCPQCGSAHQGEIVERRSRKGRLFYGCSRYPDCDFTVWKLPDNLTRVEERTEHETKKESALT